MARLLSLDLGYSDLPLRTIYVGNLHCHGTCLLFPLSLSSLLFAFDRGFGCRCLDLACGFQSAAVNFRGAFTISLRLRQSILSPNIIDEWKVLFEFSVRQFEAIYDLEEALAHCSKVGWIREQTVVGIGFHGVVCILIMTFILRGVQGTIPLTQVMVGVAFIITLFHFAVVKIGRSLSLNRSYGFRCHGGCWRGTEADRILQLYVTRRSSVFRVALQIEFAVKGRVWFRRLDRPSQ